MPFSDPEKRRAYQREYNRLWRHKRADKLKASGKRYREKNRDARLEYSRQYSARPDVKARAAEREKTPLYRAKSRNGNLKRKYGLTVAAYDALVEAQQNRCAICGIDGKDALHGRLCVDHCHDKNAVRALLCDACNKMIGHARENEAILTNAIEYLRQHKQIASGVRSLAEMRNL